MNMKNKTDKTVSASQNCAQTMSDATNEELERWVTTTLLNDEASSDDELIEHFMQGDEVPYEQAKFYVDQRNKALRDGLTFKLESYKAQGKPELPQADIEGEIQSWSNLDEEEGGIDSNEPQAQHSPLPTLDWKSQVLHAIGQGQSCTEFALHCHPANRAKARKEYMRNAKLIVASVNNAEALAEALRKLRKSIRHAHNCKAPQAFPCSCDADTLWELSKEALSNWEWAK